MRWIGVPCNSTQRSEHIFSQKSISMNQNRLIVPHECCCILRIASLISGMECESENIYERWVLLRIGIPRAFGMSLIFRLPFSLPDANGIFSISSLGSTAVIEDTRGEGGMAGVPGAKPYIKDLFPKKLFRPARLQPPSPFPSNRFGSNSVGKNFLCSLLRSPSSQRILRRNDGCPSGPSRLTPVYITFRYFRLDSCPPGSCAGILLLSPPCLFMPEEEKCLEKIC
jgi:hypothetical protein